jgi:Tfp pilus assembly protein PilW
LRNILKPKTRLEKFIHLKLKTHDSKLSGKGKLLSEKGTTLIELLITIGLIGLVMSLIFVLTYAGVRAYASQSARVTMETQSQSFMYILTEKLRQAQPGTIGIANLTGENNESMIFFMELNQSNPVTIGLKTLKNSAGKITDRQILMYEPVYSVSGGVTTATYSASGNILAGSVVSLYFTFPFINDNTRVQVSLSQEKYPFSNQPPVNLQSTQVIYVRN